MKNGVVYIGESSSVRIQPVVWIRWSSVVSRNSNGFDSLRHVFIVKGNTHGGHATDQKTYANGCVLGLAGINLCLWSAQLISFHSQTPLTRHAFLSIRSNEPNILSVGFDVALIQHTICRTIVALWYLSLHQTWRKKMKTNILRAPLNSSGVLPCPTVPTPLNDLVSATNGPYYARPRGISMARFVQMTNSWSNRIPNLVQLVF